MPSTLAVHVRREVLKRRDLVALAVRMHRRDDGSDQRAAGQLDQAITLDRSAVDPLEQHRVEHRDPTLDGHAQGFGGELVGRQHRADSLNLQAAVLANCRAHVLVNAVAARKHGAESAGVGLDECDQLLDAVTQPTVWWQRRIGCSHLEYMAHSVTNDRREKVALVREVVVHQPARNTGLLCDLFDPDIVERALSKQARADLYELLSPGLG